MDQLTRGRARVAIVSVTLGAIGAFVGAGSSQLVACAVFGVPGAAPARSSEVALEGRTVRDGCALLDGHQFFDSALHVSCDGVVDPPLPPTAPVSAGAESPCDSTVRLVGSYVRRADASQSFAAITGAAGTTLLYREGDSVEGRAVLAILENTVVLAPADGPRCQIAMFEQPGPPLAMLSGVVVAPVPDTRPTPSPDIGAHIERISETRYAIDHGFVDELLAYRGWPLVRMMPEESNGQVVGMRIFGVTRSSLLGHLGIENGDSIRTINGYDMTDPAAALDAYAHLLRAHHLTLNLARRGQPMAIEYEIR